MDMNGNDVTPDPPRTGDVLGETPPHTAMQQVPKTVGLPVSEAVDLLTSSDFLAHVQRVEPEALQVAGVTGRRRHDIVVSQDPPGGARHPVGAPVTVHVPTTQAARSFSRWIIAVAAVVLVGVGIAIAGAGADSSPSSPAPSAPSTQPPAETVPQTATTVPNLIGKSPGAASALLLGSSLQEGSSVVVLRGEKFRDLDSNSVAEQYPTPDTLVPPNTPVATAIRSSSEDGITVPDTLGQTEADAVAALKQQDLLPLTLTAASSRPAGSVVASLPSPQQAVPTDAREVLLFISDGSVSTPNVIGLRPGEATATVLEAGLRIRIDRTNQPAGSGERVLSQVPAAATPVKRGTEIVVQVG